MEDHVVTKGIAKEQLLSNKLKRIWRGIFHHGLFLYTTRNLLSRIGIDIHPYWIEKEDLSLCTNSISITNPQDYNISTLGYPELKKLADSIKWVAPAIPKYEAGNYRVIGLFQGSSLAAFTMAQFDHFEFKGKRFKLKSNEAYLENMYTFEDYRGKNLAPYLRYQCYLFLLEEGKNQFYSITQYFNKSSLKFKAKLKAEHLVLWLHIGLFKRFRRNFLLKKYTDQVPLSEKQNT